MAIYYIADLHLGHQNILSYDNRPFKNIEEHDKIIIDNWKKTVSDEDDIYILGDISWYDVKTTINIIQGLPGKKHLIIGNHDKKLLKNKNFRELFVETTDYKELSFGNNSGVVLCHYPIPCFNKHFYGWYHLYGHVHNSFEFHMMERIKYEMENLYEKPCNMFNVGAMMGYMNYTPRRLEYIVHNC